MCRFLGHRAGLFQSYRIDGIRSVVRQLRCQRCGTYSMRGNHGR